MPADTPVTMPLVEPTIAKAVLLLAQIPPDVVLANGVDEPVHTLDAPVIAAGNGFTVSTPVIKQPVGNV